MDAQTAVVAARFVAWTCMLAKAGIMAHVVFRLDMQQTITSQIPFFNPYRRHVLVGLMLGAIGWGLHQMFFWFVQVASNVGATDLRVRMLDQFAWLTFPAYILIVVGTVMVMSPYTASRVGKLWWLASAAVVLFLFLIGLSYGGR